MLLLGPVSCGHVAVVIEKLTAIQGKYDEFVMMNMFVTHGTCPSLHLSLFLGEKSGS